MESSKEIICFSFIMIALFSFTTEQNPCTSGPQDCILTDWEVWGECSHSCGTQGVQERRKTVLLKESCGGACNGNRYEFSACNRHCCCEYENWSKWVCPYVSNTTCLTLPGKLKGTRYVCNRKRNRIPEPECEGTCEAKTTDAACSSLWCFATCIVGEWSFWGNCVGQCEQEGTQYKTRLIERHPVCGAGPCPDLEQNRTCAGRCCPVDCKLGDWSVWSECNTTCGIGQKTRLRFVQKPECYGKACSEEPTTSETVDCEKYVNEDCVVSPWSSWSSCVLQNGFCGEGQKNRSRSVIVDVKCQGQPCPDLVENEVCYGPCCRQDCEFSEWSNWGLCSTDCGTGNSTRKREITKNPSCNGTECPTLSERIECKVEQKVDCEMTGWSEWSECNNKCGTGKQFRSRSVKTKAYCGGADCADSAIDDEQQCYSEADNKDCVMNEWTAWGECEINCEGGVKQRTRTIKENAICNGIPCPSMSVSDWGAWEACILTCNGGYRPRRRTVTQNAECKGKPCPTLIGAKFNCMNYTCDQGCTNGICHCGHGYRLENGYRCVDVRCPRSPTIQYCPDVYTFITSCRYPKFSCTGDGYLHNCTAKCQTDWDLKGVGADELLTCQLNGKWTTADIFCIPKNEPPNEIFIEQGSTLIAENTLAGTCITALKANDSSYDKHTFSIVSDEKSIFEIKENYLCLNETTNYEIPPIKWEATIRCTDMEGLYFDKTIQFEIINKNDPPTAVELNPNTIPENSPAGTKVGCLTGKDDDPGQSVSLLLVDSDHDIFETYKENEQLCLKVKKESDPLCATDGGTYCVLNMEKRKRRSVTILAKDNGSPSEEAYVDVKIILSNANDRPQQVKLNPEKVPEEVAPGEPIADLVTVDEDRGQTYTYVLQRDDDGIFSIKDGKLICNRKLNYEAESQKEFVIEVNSTDSGTPPLSVSSTIKFMIDDVNEVPFDLELTSSSGELPFDVDKPMLRENKRPVMIGTISVKDEDGDDLDLTLEDTTNSRLALMYKRCKAVTEVKSYCTARLISYDTFNYETELTIPVIITATDTNGLYVQKNLTMNIVNLNDPPSDILINGNSTTEIRVPENKNSYKIAELDVKDEDTQDLHGYSLIKTANGLFQIKDGNILMTSTTANLDYESVDTHEITVLVLDNGEPQLMLEKIFTMKVTNENEAPTAIYLSNDKVTENSPEGTPIGKFTADDPDNVNTVTQTFIYTLIDDGSGRFQIVGDDLKVRKSDMMCNSEPCILDYEVEPVIEIKVNVIDNGVPPLSYEQTFSVYLDDANDPPTNIRLNRNGVRENENPGATVGKLSAADQDVGQSLSFTLVDNTDIFALGGDNSVVTKVTLDHEQKSEYNLTARCTDNGTPQTFTDTVLTINVLDVNEAPRYAGAESLEVSEQTQIGGIVGKLTATDVDNDDALTFSIGSSTEFKVQDVTCQTKEPSGIECTGDLVTMATLDFEIHSTYQVVVNIQDRKGMDISQKLTINVQDENDAPQNIYFDGKSLEIIEVDENIENTDIATLSTEDPDQGQTFTYIIKSGDGGIFEIVSDKLRVKGGSSLDYEQKTEYVLVIEVTDSGTPAKSLEKSVTVQLQNVNEPPQSLAISNDKVLENSDDGKVIGTLSTVDPDNINQNIQTFSYILVDSADGRFKVQNGQLQVALSNQDCIQNGGESCKLDYETTQIHKVSVLVTDSGQPSKSNTFNLDITLTDTNDPPRNIILSDYKVTETAAKGTEIGTLTVDDQDVGQTHTFSMVNDASGLFSVTSDGIVKTATDSRLDVTKFYEIVVRAVDNGSPQGQVESTFTITVTGVNEAPVSVTFTSENAPVTFEDNAPVVMENSPIDTVIGSVVAKDQDPDQQLTFEVKTTTEVQFIKTDTAPTCITENGMSTCKMKILVTATLDHESMSELTFVVQVTDKDGMKMMEIFKLLIQDQNEAPTELKFSSSELQVKENLQSYTLGMFQVVDPDDGDSHTWTLTNDGSGNFVIDNTGRLSTSEDAKLDYETMKTIDITVTVTDNGGLSLDKSYTISILDVNEPPIKLDLSTNTVQEISPVDMVVGQLIATDPDEGQTMTYKLLDEAGGRFKVQGNEIKVNAIGDQCLVKGGQYCLLDYETKTTFDLVVKATDSGDPPYSVEFTLTVNVEDGNDAPTDLTMTADDIPENTAVGQTVASFTAKDVDGSQTLTYILVDSDTNTFSMEENALKLSAKLDFEEKSLYNITVDAEDNGNPPKKLNPVNCISSVQKFFYAINRSMQLSEVKLLLAEITEKFVLKVINANEAPYKLQMEPKSGSEHFTVNQPIITENKPVNSLIGQLVVLDHDSTDSVTFDSTNPEIELYNRLSFPLTKGIRSTVDVRSRKLFDFEKEPSLSLYFTATDIEGASINLTVTLVISDANDPPTDLLLNGQSVDSLTVVENSRDITLSKLSAADPDNGQTHSFSILSETKYFYVVGNDLKVTSAAELDYEREPVQKVKIRVTDHGQPPLYLDKEISVQVTDVNEKPTSVQLSRNQVAENSKNGDLVGTLNTVDPDNVQKQIQTFEYTLIDIAGNRFKVEGNNLMVSSADFDFEVTRSYSVKVNVTDSGEPKMWLETAFTIDITDSNDAPKDLKISADIINENTDLGTVVGTLSAVDDDVGQTLSYSVEDNDFLTVSGNKLLVNGPVDFETTQFIHIQTSVTDNGVPPLSAKKSFTLQVRDLNDEPDKLELMLVDKFKNGSISEDTKIREVIGTIVAEDPDAVDHLNIVLVKSEEAAFKLSSTVPHCTKELVSSGREKTKCSIDLQMAKVVNYEDRTAPLELSIKVLDKGKLELTRSWTFDVTNANEPPRDIKIDSEVQEIPENDPGFIVGFLETTDEDEGDTHSYQIIKNWESFSISHSILGKRLVVKKIGLDYESRQTEEVTIRVKDSGGLTYTKVFSYKVKDVNERPTEILLSLYKVSNGAEVGEVVALVTVTDPDNSGDDETVKQNHTCTVGGDGLDVFQVDSSTMALKVQSKIPLEITELNMTITCTDTGVPPLSMTESVTLSVQETVTVPKGIILKNQTKVPENTLPFTVGTLQVVNLLTQKPDQFVMFFMKQDDLPFEIAGTDLVVKSSSPLDYEAQMEYIVGVEAGGSGGVMLEKNFTIEVEDVNEPPHGVSIGSPRIAENSDSGTVIAKLHTQDSETDQSYTYTILAVASGLDVSLAEPGLMDTFEISEGILKVGSAKENLNFETGNISSILINTVDSGSPPLSYNGTVRVMIEDVNDPPTEITLDQITVAENSDVGTHIGTFSVEDEDRGQTHKCDILNLNVVPFKVQDKVKLVVSKKEIDYEKTRKYVVDVQCLDISEKFSSQQIRNTFTIDVTNVNEAPYNIVLSNSDIEENNAAGDLVGEIQATDIDSESVTFSLKNQADFAIQGDHTLVVNKELDFEVKSRYTIVITATDTEGLMSSENFTIMVTDVNEAPTLITLNNVLVEENSSPGSVIGILKTADPDRGQTFTYTLAESTAESGYFGIKENKLVVGEKTIDFEKISEHQIFINSTDSGTPSKTIQTEFTINVKDVNEPPLTIILGTLAPIEENSPVNTPLSAVQVDDPDSNQSHLCKVVTSTTPFSILTNEKKEMSLVLSGSLDFESKSEYNLNIQCTDGEFNKEKAITVTVKDVNEAPESISLSGTKTIVANAEPGYLIGQLSVKDPDIGQKFTFSIKGRNSDLMEIKDSSLQMLTTIPVIYLEADNPVIQINISAADNGNPSLSVTQIFTLPITNIQLVADELPTITLDNQNLKEDAEVGTVIGALHDRETALGKDIVFQLSNNHGGVFSIKDNKYLVLAKSLMDVDGPSIIITVTVKNTQTFDTSSSDITVFIERIDKCNKNGKTCSENGRCVKINNTSHECQCEIGFEGDGYTCQDINDCVVQGPDGNKVPGNLCQNEGVCKDQDNGYACECLKGFIGPNCEINNNKPSPCDPNPCKNNAACIPDRLSDTVYTCECAVGWMGDHCDKSIDDCKRLKCYAGTCVDKHRTILCLCPPERKGVWCEYIKTTCVSTNPCTDSKTVCVPKVNKDASSCTEKDKSLVTLTVKKPTVGTFDREQFMAKTKEVISSLCDRVENVPARRKRAAENMPTRVKRQTADPIGVDTYIVKVTDNGDGTIDVVMAIRDPNGDIYNKTVVVNILVKACSDINSKADVETEYCPAVMELQTQPEPAPQPDKGLPIPIIAGAAGGGVLLIIVVVVIIVVCKKKQSKSTVDPSTERNKDKDEVSESGSRRSSGYSSLRRKNQQENRPMSEFQSQPEGISSEREGHM